MKIRVNEVSPGGLIPVSRSEPATGQKKFAYERY